MRSERLVFRWREEGVENGHPRGEKGWKMKGKSQIVTKLSRIPHPVHYKHAGLRRV